MIRFNPIGTPAQIARPTDDAGMLSLEDNRSRRKNTPGDQSMRRSIQDLVSSVDPHVRIEPEVEDVSHWPCAVFFDVSYCSFCSCCFRSPTSSSTQSRTLVADWQNIAAAIHWKSKISSFILVCLTILSSCAVVLMTAPERNHNIRIPGFASDDTRIALSQAAVAPSVPTAATKKAAQGTSMTLRSHRLAQVQQAKRENKLI